MEHLAKLDPDLEIDAQYSGEAGRSGVEVQEQTRYSDFGLRMCYRNELKRDIIEGRIKLSDEEIEAEVAKAELDIEPWAHRTLQSRPERLRSYFEVKHRAVILLDGEAPSE